MCPFKKNRCVSIYAPLISLRENSDIKCFEYVKLSLKMTLIYHVKNFTIFDFFPLDSHYNYIPKVFVAILVYGKNPMVYSFSSKDLEQYFPVVVVVFSSLKHK